MEKFEKTRLWRVSLAVQPGEDDGTARLREELRAAYFKFRERVQALVAEMPQDLKDFTVHDITHIDALWEMADTVAGPDLTLTPTEGFVLGGVFLLHDSGMGLAAYPDGLSELRKHPLWIDTVSLLLRKHLNRVPEHSELRQPPETICRQADVEALRVRHAEQAEGLPSKVWAAASGDEYRLIEDTDLREIYGTIIGRIAHSHWWHISELRGVFEHILGAPGRYPGEWQVDPFKIACLLRVSDAVHLDDRRAPGFIRALRQPGAESDEHWKFQGKLLQPRRDDSTDRLYYTSKSSFELQESKAWWLCFDTLRGTVDVELRQVDQLLADCHRARFGVRGVANIEEPSRFAELVQTRGWEPVDARVQVSDVVGLIQALGGEQMYGRNLKVPLRELIQNAADAVRARRLLQGRENNWGEVTVKIGEDQDGSWIEVEDSGVGMSSRVLTGAFLDFGTSLWQSPLIVKEHPGLLAKRFTSTGKFGIGFFSVFMWGKHVRVTTRRYDEAERDTKVLEFEEGLKTRPFLRKANQDEYIQEGGTRVRVWLTQKLEHIFAGDKNHIQFPEDLCAWLCPSLDVNLFVEYERASVPTRLLSVGANDWLSMEGSLLINRVWNLKYLVGTSDPGTYDKWEQEAEALGKNLRLITRAPDSSGHEEVVGRACLFKLHKSTASFTNCAVTVGGLRACDINGLAGIITGFVQKASRDLAFPIANYDELAAWAKEQIVLVRELTDDPEHLELYAEVVRFCRADTGSLPIARCEDEWISADEVRSDTEFPEEILGLPPI